MVTIEPGTQVATVINVFTVVPERQHELVALVEQTAEEVMRHQPGFIAASVHASQDGQRVITYAQWRGRQDLEAMLADPTARQHMEQITAIATADPRFYDVSSVHQP